MLSVTGSGQKKGGDARPIRLGASGSENQGKASINFRDANLQSGHRRKNSAWYPLFRSLTGVNRTWPERPVSVVIDPQETSPALSEPDIMALITPVFQGS